MVGTFYKSPSPEEGAYVQVGDKVSNATNISTISPEISAWISLNSFIASKIQTVVSFETLSSIAQPQVAQSAPQVSDNAQAQEEVADNYETINAPSLNSFIASKIQTVVSFETLSPTCT
jgi:hypothetical protein